ncbi:hypothetical protein BT67DRAFT_140564 [Trichocladium antarcticum]|uniref:Extracellular membrane protein CFEM domain-containing protein n=1 Tax=Trichocladium antarcticum TaxID=1450529 RepID=A0AAN6UFW9_9PEZI|nr:hypothetical protein BT67DRAFT_140564 [Trichocladium antarcticum]
MVFTRHLRLALAGTALLLSFAGRAESASTVLFTDCVDSCVVTSGCRTTDCMCTEARGFMLDSVIACMFFNCKPDLRNFDDAFLDPIAELCDDNNRKIPSAKLDKAETLASSYISKLPAATTAKTPVVVVATSTPAPLTTAQMPSSSAKQAASSATMEQDTPSQTPSAVQNDDAESTSAATEAITAEETLVLAPTSSTESSAAEPTESDTSESETSGSRNSNADPFANPPSAAWRTQTSLSLLGLPLVLAMFAALR